MPDNPKLAWEIDPDQPLSLEETPFSAYEMEVRDHWSRFLPKLTAGLRAQGPEALELAIRKAVHRQIYLEDLELARNPDLHPDQVEELFRGEVFLTPETPPDNPEPDLSLSEEGPLDQ